MVAHFLMGVCIMRLSPTRFQVLLSVTRERAASWSLQGFEGPGRVSELSLILCKTADRRRPIPALFSKLQGTSIGFETYVAAEGRRSTLTLDAANRVTPTGPRRDATHHSSRPTAGHSAFDLRPGRRGVPMHHAGTGFVWDFFSLWGTCRLENPCVMEIMIAKKSTSNAGLPASLSQHFFLLHSRSSLHLSAAISCLVEN